MQEATLDGFDGFVRDCNGHREAQSGRTRAVAIRANPLDIAGLPPTGSSIPNEGLSAANQVQARLCEGGSAQACSYIAFQFSRGTNAPLNDNWAVALYVKSCTGGRAQGCSNLGYHLEGGRGVRRDYARSAIFYQRGCEGGDFLACSNWGILIHNGTGVDRNYQTAANLLERGCNGGNVGGSIRGCLVAAEIYETGRGPVPQDRTKALQLADAGLRLEPANARLIAIRDRLR